MVIKFWNIKYLIDLVNLPSVSTKILNNIFFNNKAFNDGGALKWMGLQPIIESNNEFQNNTAMYGENIASYGVRLRLDIYENNSLLFSTLNNKEIINLKNISSGNKIQYKLIFYIIDVYDNIVRSAKGWA